MKDLDTRKFRTRNLMLLEDRRDHAEDLKNRGYVGTKWEPPGSLDMSTWDIATTTVMTGCELLKFMRLRSEKTSASEQVILDSFNPFLYWTESLFLRCNFFKYPPLVTGQIIDFVSVLIF